MSLLTIDPHWQTWLNWMATYWVHSTLLLGVVWLVTTVLGNGRFWLQEALWKGALIGGLVTATIQVGDWHQWAQARPAPATIGEQIGDPGLAAADLELMPATSQTSDSGIVVPRSIRWLQPLWGTVAAVLILAFAWRWAVFCRRLNDRSMLTAGAQRSMLDQLCADAGHEGDVRLSASSQLMVPVAMGSRRGEICLPQKMLTQLSSGQQRAAIAHELAHLVRRDPVWRLVVNLLAVVFFFQPLNRLAGRQLRRLSEYLCDDWAVQQTRNRRSLARCLTEVAGWSLDRRAARMVATMIGGSGELSGRVRRLIEVRRRRIPSRLWINFWITGVVGFLAVWLPATTFVEAEMATPEAPRADRDADRELQPESSASGFVPVADDPSPDRRDSPGVTFAPHAAGATGVVAPEFRIAPESRESWNEVPEQEPSAAPEAEPAFAGEPTAAPLAKSWSGGVTPESESAPESPEASSEGPEAAQTTPLEEESAESVEDAGSESRPKSSAEIPATSAAPKDLPESTAAAESSAVAPNSSSAPGVSVEAPRASGEAPSALATAAPLAKPNSMDHAPNLLEPSERRLDTPPVLISRSNPRFPRMAIKLNKVRATVPIKLTIDATGRVTDAVLVGDKVGFGFDREAIRSVRRSVYRPATKNGEPVAYELMTTVHFLRRP